MRQSQGHATSVVRFHRHGDPDVLEVEDDVVGTPGAGEVRLTQSAVGVNFVDTLLRRGAFPGPLPAVAGVEGAGVIDAVGEGVHAFQRGDRVAYYFAAGSYAGERLVPAAALVKVPVDVALEAVPTFLTKGLTAWAGVNGYYRVGEGAVVLVQGATSGVGRLLARMARRRGATVIGTTGSAAKEAALAADVDHVLSTSAPNLAERVRALAPGGVDVVYEFVGRATFASSAGAVRDGGTIANIGAASGPPEIDMAGLASRGVRVVGGPMGRHVEASRDLAIEEVFQSYRDGVFAGIDVVRLPLAQAREAHRAIDDRKRTGAIVLTT